MGRTQTCFTEAYTQISADCDIETPSCHNNHLCQIIFKSLHAIQREMGRIQIGIVFSQIYIQEIKVVKILQELAESEPKAHPKIKGKDGQTFLNIITELLMISRVCISFQNSWQLSFLY